MHFTSCFAGASILAILSTSALGQFSQVPDAPSCGSLGESDRTRSPRLVVLSPWQPGQSWISDTNPWYLPRMPDETAREEEVRRGQAGGFFYALSDTGVLGFKTARFAEDDIPGRVIELPGNTTTGTGPSSVFVPGRPLRELWSVESSEVLNGRYEYQRLHTTETIYYNMLVTCQDPLVCPVLGAYTMPQFTQITLGDELSRFTFAADVSCVFGNQCDASSLCTGQVTLPSTDIHFVGHRETVCTDPSAFFRPDVPIKWTSVLGPGANSIIGFSTEFGPTSNRWYGSQFAAQLGNVSGPHLFWTTRATNGTWSGSPVVHRELSGELTPTGYMLGWTQASLSRYRFAAAAAYQGVFVMGTEGDGSPSSDTPAASGVYLATGQSYCNVSNDPGIGFQRYLTQGMTARDVSQGMSGNGTVTLDNFYEAASRGMNILVSGNRHASLVCSADTNAPGDSYAVIGRYRRPWISDDVVSYIKQGQKLPLPPEVGIADSSYVPPGLQPGDRTGEFVLPLEVLIAEDNSVFLVADYIIDPIANNQPDQGPTQTGIWQYRPASGWQPIVVPGQFARDGGTILGRFVGNGELRIALNGERKEYAYLADVMSSSTGSVRSSLFRGSELCGSNSLVMSVGDTVVIAQSDGLSSRVGLVEGLAFNAGTNGEDGKPQSLNNRGELLFAARLSFVTDPMAGATEKYDALYISTSSPICNDIDFNNDGVFPDELDTTDLLNVWAGLDCSTCDSLDFNGNGVWPEESDLACYFALSSGASCSACPR